MGQQNLREKRLLPGGRWSVPRDHPLALLAALQSPGPELLGIRGTDKARGTAELSGPVPNQKVVSADRAWGPAEGSGAGTPVPGKAFGGLGGC